MELGSLPRITIIEIVKYLSNSGHVGPQMQRMKSENNICTLSDTQVDYTNAFNKILNQNRTILS